MKRNVALIGFMGVGKTTIGEALASRLKKRFVRTDDLIVELAKRPIPQIFREEGESRFRELEMEVVKQVSEEDNVVIDCGGGVVLNRVNIQRLRNKAKIVLLTASPETILRRVKNDSSERPLLNVPNQLERIKELLAARESSYKESADFEVDTSYLDKNEAADRISHMLRGNCPSGSQKP
ncbi:shikimate kinase [Candidatus Bathyarchaeota archaeon]|jgi:shikimate kinase|nr:shikimate kinase [Candidatus Bathyarchaeota archaeon]